MFKPFRFTLFVLLWGLCFVFPYGMFLGWGYLVAWAAIWRVFFYRTASTLGRTAVPPPELFALPKLKLSGEALTIPPEFAAKIVRRIARINAGFRIFHPHSPGSMGIYLSPIGGTVFCVCALFNAPFSVPAGGIAMVLCVLNLLIFLPAAIAFRHSLRHFNAVQSKWLATVPRPAFDPEDIQQRNHFCRHFSDAFKARIALDLVKALKIDFMVYPEDALWLLARQSRLPELVAFLDRFGLEPQLETLGELIERRAIGNRTAVDFSDLPAQNPVPQPSPAWPEELRQLIKTKDDRFLRCNDRQTDVFLRSRPFSREEFASYWPTRREAEIAWVIRDAAIEIMGRPKDIMTYPNDPMAILDFWKGDSLDMVEFIMALEEHFGISIPEAEAQKFFDRFDLRDAVHYIIEKSESENYPEA